MLGRETAIYNILPCGSKPTRIFTLILLWLNIYKKASDRNFTCAYCTVYTAKNQGIFNQTIVCQHSPEQTYVDASTQQSKIRLFVSTTILENAMLSLCKKCDEIT